MITILALALACQAQTVDVGQFFPLTVGTKWTYLFDTTGGRQELVYFAGKEVKVGKNLGVPVYMGDEKGSSGTIFYRVANNVVDTLGIDATRPLEPPRAVLKGGTMPQKWTWEGLDGGVIVHMDAEANLKGTKAVLGSQRQIIELRIVADVGTRQDPHIVRQTATYASGVGLVEMQTEDDYRRRKTKITQTLVKFEPGVTKT